jgi:gamma-D-glutamyl-L-lysine dipeptidyl-peptidase
MKKRSLLLGILILLQIFMAGCGVKKIVTVSVDIKTNETSGAVEKTGSEAVPETKISEGDETDYKNMGVITDTVVDVFREPDTQSERVTQTIFNQPVEILEKQENWAEVKVVDGYTGWIKLKYMQTDCSGIKAGDFKYKLVVTGKQSKITSQASGKITLREIVMGTELYSKNKVDSCYEVALPDSKTGWISENGIIQLPVDAQIPKTSTEDFIDTLKKFKGTIYLWGGVSAWGIDCSGLTYICSRVNGVTLPRDADQQFKLGEVVPVGVSSMKPGDLLFFSTNTDKKDISHVAVYIGTNQFIHASNAKGSVTTGSLTQEYYSSRLVGVKRIF